MMFKSSTTWGLVLAIVAVGILVIGSAFTGFRRTSKVPEMVSDQSHGVSSEEIRVREILRREFNGLFGLDDRWILPTYAFGDLNGDETTDLVAAVRVEREIDPNDRSSPSFRFEKVMHCGKPCATAARDESLLTTGHLRWYSDHNQSILVVIHGTRERGLLSTRQEQRFVLVDGWHKGEVQMSLFKGKLKIARFGDELKLQPPPDLIGSAILLMGPEKSGSAVYWDGGSYRSYEVPSSPN